MSFPTISHWAAVEHILCYLKETFGRGILYKKHGHTKLSAFQTQTGQDLWKTRDAHQDIMSLLEEI